MKNHIAKNFNAYWRSAFTIQWLGMLGFIGFGIFGMWFFSVLSLVGSFGALVLRIVIKKITAETIVKAIKDVPKNSIGVIEAAPIPAKLKRRLKRKHIRKHSTK